jgi:hypothetical protein
MLWDTPGTPLIASPDLCVRFVTFNGHSTKQGFTEDSPEVFTEIKEHMG